MFKVLVANRGEIAVRILRSAGELGWTTVAIYTEGDESHATFAHEAVKLGSVSDYLDVEKVVSIALRSKCTHLHPGYGFLSENPALARALSLTNEVTFIGPSEDTLRIASNKVLSRDLAQSLGVNVAPGAEVLLSEDVEAFALREGFPVMLKALDGGGGRGIRLVESSQDITDAYDRCLGESVSKQLFVEKAMTGAFWKHIEIQIVGDGSGAVNHLWERECSVQRRFQKIVEMAPSGLPLANIKPLLDSSMKIAKHLRYRGLGTFEFLVNSQTLDWIFLEINPRIQVEHTITEEITGIDLVRVQLLLFTATITLSSLSLVDPLPPPRSCAVQLRLTAEDPSQSFRLSPGTLRPTDFAWPLGPGIRTDTWLCTGPFLERFELRWNLGTEFDSLLAKIIVTGRTFEEMTQRARFAMRELRMEGQVITNREVLAGVLLHADWPSGIDTLWLERNIRDLLDLGRSFLRPVQTRTASNNSTTTPVPHGPSGNILLHPGTSFHLTLSPSSNGEPSVARSHTLMLSSISHNTFPERVSGVLQSSFLPGAFDFSLSQTATVPAGAIIHEIANIYDASHIASHLTGKIVQLHPALIFTKESTVTNAGNRRFVKEGDVLVTFSVMKMESVVKAPRDALVERLGKGVEVGAVLGEGCLVCVLGDNQKLLVSRI